MGYKGYRIFSTDANVAVRYIKAAPEAELYLLENFKPIISETVHAHVVDTISKSVYNLNKEQAIKMLTYGGENSGFLKSKKQKLNANACEKTPIVGPDDIPVYDPDTDDQGCFETMQYDNNCYNYGTDVLTNTFAQPGVGSGQKWSTDTCADIQASAIRDGLQYIGQKLPKEKPSEGHFITLLMWPDTNFHWVRLDKDGTWSHKPGSTEVRNVDNNGKSITDPSTQDFSPWTDFCGYFLVVPGQVIIG